MEITIKILIGLIAIIHFYFLWFEMFAWTTAGKKIFHKFPNEFFKQTKSLAANQGLYNGFLAAGLLWSIGIDEAYWQKEIALFFLVCVAIAGAYGAILVDKKIFFVQALPAIFTIVLLSIFS